MLTTTHHFTALARNSTVQHLKRSVSTTTPLTQLNTRTNSFAHPARLARANPPQRFFSSTSRINMPPLPVKKAEEVGE